MSDYFKSSRTPLIVRIIILGASTALEQFTRASKLSAKEQSLQLLEQARRGLLVNNEPLIPADDGFTRIVLEWAADHPAVCVLPQPTASVPSPLSCRIHHDLLATNSQRVYCVNTILRPPPTFSLNLTFNAKWTRSPHLIYLFNVMLMFKSFHGHNKVSEQITT